MREARWHHYVALIHKDVESDFGVSFPDFPGYVAAGVTIDEAQALALEALGLHLEGLVETAGWLLIKLRSRLLWRALRAPTAALTL